MEYIYSRCCVFWSFANFKSLSAREFYIFKNWNRNHGRQGPWTVNQEVNGPNLRKFLHLLPPPPPTPRLRLPYFIYHNVTAFTTLYPVKTSLTSYIWTVPRDQVYYESVIYKCPLSILSIYYILTYLWKGTCSLLIFMRVSVCIFPCDLPAITPPPPISCCTVWQGFETWYVCNV
jgi:hypothetical protein